jgi:hypothetical protein
MSGKTASRVPQLGHLRMDAWRRKDVFMSCSERLPEPSVEMASVAPEWQRPALRCRHCAAKY